jgi:hypothetical protein
VLFVLASNHKPRHDRQYHEHHEIYRARYLVTAFDVFRNRQASLRKQLRCNQGGAQQVAAQLAALHFCSVRRLSA